MKRAHFDTVLMIVTGRVVPYLELETNKVQTIGNKASSLDNLYETLAKTMGSPVNTHDIPGVLWVVAAYFKKEYPEIREDTDFPLIWELYESWRGSFLTKHDLPDWYDVPVLNTEKVKNGRVSRGTRVEFILPEDRRVSVFIP